MINQLNSDHLSYCRSRASLATGMLATGMLFGSPALAQESTSEPLVSPAEAGELRQVREELAEVNEQLRQIKEDVARERQQRHEPHRVRADRVSYGQVVTVKLGESVEEVVAFGNDVEIAGVVIGDATSFGGDIVITETGQVGGDAVSFGGRVLVSNGGSVSGDRVALGMPGVSSSPQVAVATSQEAVGSVGSLVDQDSIFDTLYRRLILLLSFAGAGVLVVGLFPDRVGRIASNMEAHPLRSAVVGTFATGFLALFSLLFAVITLGLGLPVSMVVWVFLGLAWLMGFVGLCQAIGDRLPFEQKPHGRWLAFLIGTVLLTCMSSLPLVGWLVIGGASLIGVGAALSTRFGGR